MALLALLEGNVVGQLHADAEGRPQFRYDSQWQAKPEAVPVSLSLPLAAQEHASETVAAVLWGLLPDNEHTIRRWAAKFQVSARNPIALLSHVGEDCAGAVQYVRPERLDACLSGESDHVRWLDTADVAEMLRRLRRDVGATRLADDVGQFSLAGAQAKTALLLQDKRWGVPAGRIPTTHILKPPSGEYDGFAENEHFCLRLAHALGLPVAGSAVLHFDDEIALVVERYDRIMVQGEWRRVHQEDFCQSLGIHPQHKYQNEGGPAPAVLAEVLRTHSGRARADLETLASALAFNWLLAGTDAHAKNYSLLLGPRGRVRLAPLYDLLSALPYRTQMNPHKIKLAMKIGSHYRWWQVTANDWRLLAAELRLEENWLVEMLKQMADQLPDLAQLCAASMAANGLTHPVIPRMVEEIAAVAKRARRLLDQPSQG